MIEYWLSNWTILPVAISIATFASLMGIGGGILWAPYLILVEELEPKNAVMISFMIQFIGMGSATYRYFRNNMIYWRIAWGMLLPLIIGLSIGAFTSQKLAGGGQLSILLGFISLGVSLIFGFQTEKYDQTLNEDKKIMAPNWLKIQGNVFGFISGLLSIGSGDFIIPLLRGKLKIPMINAIGTALFLNFFVALCGSLFHFILSDNIESKFLYIFTFGATGVLIGGQLGPLLSKRFDESRLKELFVFVLLLIGLHLIYQVL
ncbi:MAG: sulfite exporter TauE/SafE family protein [Spirochaetia bacterium]|nr:sulfite exporter TauE/SafE family protein [Spirochaetia bacterium]